MTEIITAKTAGFCFGVKRAIDMACKAAEEKGNIYTLGPLIHNNDVIADLREKGITPVNDQSEAKGCIIIRSHGVGRSTYDDIARLGLECIDATCPYVAKIHKIVDENTADGSDLLIAGDGTHPEVIGIIGFAHGHTETVNNCEELDKLQKSDKNFGAKPLIVVAQTTFDMCKWTDLQKSRKKN